MKKYYEHAKMETKVHLMASADQFYDYYCNKTYLIANIYPETIESVELQKGEWGTEGSIISWNYLYEGKKCVCKEVVEGIDRDNHKANFKVIEGDPLELYKSFKFIMEVSPKEQGSVVHWVLEYEKQNDQIPEPHTMLQIVVDESTKLDAYLTKDHN